MKLKTMLDSGENINVLNISLGHFKSFQFLLNDYYECQGIQIKKILNLILGFGFSKGLLNRTIVVFKIVNFAKD